MQSMCAVSLFIFWMCQTSSTWADEFSSSCTFNITNPALLCTDSRMGRLRGFISTRRSVLCMWFAVCGSIFLHIKQLGQIYCQDFCNHLQNCVSKQVVSGSCPAAGTVDVLHTSAFCCSFKGILRSGWPHLVEIVYFCSAEVWEAQRNLVPANTSRMFRYPGAWRTPWASWNKV